MDNNKKVDLSLPTQYLNSRAGRNFDPKNKVTRRLVKARVAEGRTIEDFKKVIDRKVNQWSRDHKMLIYLRPSTLFNATNFENYINEPESETLEGFERFLK